MSNEKTKGEGDRESARRYNKATEDFVESAEGADAIAGHAAADHDVEDLEDAETAGKDRAAELDPAVQRDFREATE